MLRLQTRAQFQAVLAGRVVAKSAHFALHRLALAPTAVLPPPVSRAVPPADSQADMACASFQPSDAPATAGASARVRPLFAPPGLWLGAMVPKRWAKRSVTRHAIKRQIYDVAAAHLQAPQPTAFVVRLRAGFDRTQFRSASSPQLKQAVRAELLGLLTGGTGTGTGRGTPEPLPELPPGKAAP